MNLHLNRSKNSIYIYIYIKLKVKVILEQATKAQRYTLPLTSVLDGVGGQRHAPAALPPGKGPVPTVQEAGWASGPIWTGAEDLKFTGTRSPGPS